MGAVDIPLCGINNIEGGGLICHARKSFSRQSLALSFSSVLPRSILCRGGIRVPRKANRGAAHFGAPARLASAYDLPWLIH